MLAVGCTCKNTFPIPFNKDDIQALVVTYRNNKTKKIILEKSLVDCELEDGFVHVNLNQEDTLKFDDKIVVEIQIKIKLIDDSVVKSKKMKTVTDEVLNREVL